MISAVAVVVLEKYVAIVETNIRVVAIGFGSDTETAVTVVPRLDIAETQVFVRHFFRCHTFLVTLDSDCIVGRVDKHILERAV